MKRSFVVFLWFTFFVQFSYGQSNCANAQPFCTGTTYNFPASTNTSSQVGPNYGCLYSQPNPAWYYLQISNSGPIDIAIAGMVGGSSGYDVDFICWGPFGSLTNACSNLTAANTVDCSYSSASTETCNIANAIAGQFYMLLVTNYANVNQNIVFSQSGGTGATNCAILCNITAMTKTISACKPATNTYSVTGSINVFAPPTTGSLTITSSCGGPPTVMTPPFSTVIAYTMPSLTSTGTNCTLTASFSADPTCTFSTTYVAPPPCSCSQTLTVNSPTICQGSTANLTVSGATSYTWNPGGITGSSANVSPTVTTIYTVTGATGTCVTTKTTQVTVNPTPTLSPTSNSPLCSGNTLNLNAGATASSYTWTGPNSFSSNAQNPTIAGATTLATGSYTIKITSASNCTNSAVVSVSVTTTPTLTVNSPTICQGGTANLTVSGATTYTWNPGGITGSSANVSPAATTVYTVTGANGTCATTNTTQVTVNPTPTLSPTSNSPLCSGNTLNLNAGGTASTYTWTGPNSFSSNAQNPTIPGATTLATGNYTILVTSAGNCTNSAVVNVSVTTTPTLTVNSPTICQGATANLTVSGATSYTWNPGGTTGTSANVSPTTTTVYTVTGVNGTCVTTKTTQVTVNPTPTLNPTSNSPLCSGNTLNLNAGGTASTYTWTGPNSFSSNAQNPTIAGATTLATGSYTIKVTSAGGCTNTAVVNVSVTSQPVAVANNNGPMCAGSTLSLTGSGGGTYSWTGPNSFSSASQNPSIAGVTSAASGVYTLVVSIGTCTSSATTSVTINPIPTPTAQSNGSVCAGQQINLTGSGGGSYSWAGPSSFSSSSQNPSIPGATAANSGSYTLTVTGTGGCTNTAVTNVTVNPMPVIATNNPLLCVNSTFTITSSGGSTYSWSGPGGFTSGVQNPVLTNATTGMSGAYTVTVTTAAGCSNTAVSNVTVVAAPTPTASSNSPVCLNGTLQLNGSGGASYSWTGPNGFTSSSQNPTISNATLPASGVYTLLATAGTCTGVTTTSVTINPLPVVTATNNSPVCQTQAINLTGGGASTYTWTGPNSFSSNLQSPTIANSTSLNSGTYTLIATSAAGCTNSAVTTVTVNPTPNAVAGSNSPVCLNSSINLNASGGTSYSWSGPNGFTSATQNPTIPSATAVNGGTYTVMVTALGCTNVATTSVTVTSPTTNATNTGPYCAGSTIQLNAVSASSYTWSGPGGFTSNAQNPTIGAATTAMSGTYNLLVSIGTCTAASSTTVLVNALPTPTAGNSSPVCAGQALTFTGSAANSYTWSGPGGFSSNIQNPNMAAASASNAGVYTFSVTDANGCINGTTTTVTINPIPNAIAGSNSPVCLNSSINLNASGGTSYSWSGPNGFTSALQNPTIPSATAVNAGTYSVLVTALGCTNVATTSVTVTSPTTNATNTGPYCAGGTIQLNAVSASSYTWSGPGGFTSNAQNPTIGAATTAMSGTYNLLVSIGTCTAASSTTVLVNALPTPTAGNSSPVCDGQPVSFTGSAASSYTWSGPGTYSSAVQNPTMAVASLSNAGVYTFSVTDANGCMNGTTTTVTINPIPNAIAGSNSPVCLNSSINLNANGGTSYSWNGPNGFSSNLQNPTVPSATTLDAGTYTVLVTALGCTNVATTSVTVTSPTTNATNTGPYCAGATIQLNAVSATSYTWSGPGGYASNAQNPTISASTTAMSGTYNLLASIGTCTAASSTTVVVNALPSPTANSNPVCDGQTLNLNGSAASSYTWSGPGSFSSPNQNPSIAVASPSNAGVYTFSVTDVNGCINGTTTTVTVNALPVVVVNNPTVCLNQTINLTATGGNGYSWSGPNTYTSSLQNPTIVNSTTLMSGSYVVTVIDVNGCVNTGISTVSVYPLPQATTNNNGPICVNGTLLLTGGGGAAYSWTGPNGFTSSQQNPAITPVSMAANGIYTIIVTAGTCSSSATMSVTINPLPNPGIQSNSPVCVNQPINFTGSGGSAYSWSGPAGFSSTLSNPNIPVSTAANSGTYTLTVIDANNCSNSTTYPLTVNNLPVVAVAGATVCENQSINLISNGGNQYSWTGPGGFTSSLQNPSIPNSSTTMAGQYTVTVTDLNNCSNSGTTNVVINPVPTPAIVSNNPVCVNQAITIGATGGSQYSWSGPNGFFSTSQNNTLTASMAAGGNYFVTVTSPNGCSASASVNFTVNNNPSLSITSSQNKGCSPLCVTFTCQSSTPLQSSSWGMGNGTSANGVSTVQSCYTSAGVYTISANVTDANGCPGTTSYTVEAYPQPVADFNFSPLKPIEAVDEVIFTDASYGTPIVSWNWYFTNSPNNTSTHQNPSFYFPEAGTYASVLVVKSDMGCADTIIKQITVGEDFGIYVPDAFTPNGDGLNDIFQPKGFGIVKYEMIIFDRWGEKLFHTTSFEEGWDGKKQAKGDVNYAVCPQDIYTWMITTTSVFGKAHQYTGHVTLIK